MCRPPADQAEGCRGVEKQVIVVLPGATAKKPFKPSTILYDKPCRHDNLYGNIELEVFRTCLSDICASPPPMIVNRMTCNATH
jgi:hypothetical protein